MRRRKRIWFIHNLEKCTRSGRKLHFFMKGSATKCIHCCSPTSLGRGPFSPTYSVSPGRAGLPRGMSRSRVAVCSNIIPVLLHTPLLGLRTGPNEGEIGANRVQTPPGSQALEQGISGLKRVDPEKGMIKRDSGKTNVAEEIFR